MSYQPVPAARPRALGLPLVALIGLAALGVPRVVLHDLRVIEEGSPVTWLLAVLPVASWVAVAVLKRVPKPFLTVLVTGAIFGVMLAVTHQLLWDEAFSGNPPSIGDGPAGTAIPRIAAVPSGIFVGTMMGAVGGAIAHVIQRATSGRTSAS